MSQKRYDVIVVGLGVYGLSIGYYLSKKDLNILLVDQFQVGHPNGSSHSSSRITRSTYEKQIYRDLNQLCLKQFWSQLQKQFGEKLIYPNANFYFDQNQQTYQQFKKVAKSSGSALKFMSLEQIQKNHPNVPLMQTKFTPIIDENSGIIAAQTYISNLKKALLKKKNVTIKQNCSINQVSDTSNLKGYAKIKISTNEEILGKKIVLACGRWISQLIPSIKQLLSVNKQYVGYAQLKNMEMYKIENHTPSLIYFKKNAIYYALPQLKKEGFKFAEHGTRKLMGAEDTKQYQWEKLSKVGKELFGVKFIKLKQIQQCYYTATKSEDFIIDWTSPKQNILICSCCSGHGFKFSPILGKIISDLVLQDKSIQIFQKSRYMFRIAYHQGIYLE